MWDVRKSRMSTYLFKITTVLTLLLSAAVAACSHPDDDGVQQASAYEVSPVLDAILADRRDSVNPYAVRPADAPDSGCVRLRYRALPVSMGKAFDDLNPAHLEYAVAGGCQPIDDDASAWDAARGMVKIVSDRYLYIDSLTHSYPYLMPHAADLLHEIGKRFADSLAARGGGDYRLKVTSVLRTPMTVGRLRRINRNATQASAHQYGTTFDISYSKYICDNPDGVRRTFDDLKGLLAEIVYDLHAEGRCLVKHERKQACLHITAAPPAANPHRANAKNHR